MLAKYDNQDNFTGEVYLSSPDFKWVKKKNVEIRETTKEGKDMRDSKWIKIMNPTDALGEAQKDFYLMFKRHFEDELLQKLPMAIRDQMLGKAPLVMDTLYDVVKGKPDFVAKLWAKTTRSAKNIFQNTSHQKRVMVDENGDFIDTLPIFYVGNPRSEKALSKIADEIQAIKNAYKEGKLSKKRV